MHEGAIGRRTFLAGAAALTASGTLTPGEGRAQVPNSSGTEPAKVKAPANAADCHIHIYDPRFPQATPRPGRIPTNATVADYRLLQKRNGTTRVVIVTPRNYGIDNRVTVDALSQLGGNSRGIAVLHPDVADTELKALDAAGIRGIRFTLGDPATAVVKWDMVEPLAKRVASLGWHLSTSMASRSSTMRTCWDACRPRSCSTTWDIRRCRPASTTPPTA